MGLTNNNSSKKKKLYMDPLEKQIDLLEFGSIIVFGVQRNFSWFCKDKNKCDLIARPFLC